MAPVVLRDSRSVAPDFADDVCLRVDRPAIVYQPVNERHVPVRVSRVVATVVVQHSIQAEAIDALVQPETRGFLDLRPEGRVIEIEVGH